MTEESITHLDYARGLKTEKHRWFDQFLVAKGENLRGLIDRLTSELGRHEADTKLRLRARKRVDQRHHRSAIDTTVSNLAYAVLNPSETGRIAVSASHGLRGKTRYDNAALGKPFRELLHDLRELGLLNERHSRVRGEKSSIAPTSTFAAMIVDAAVTNVDFGRDGHEELVILTTKHEQLKWGGRRVEGATHKEKIDYRDTKLTTAFRHDVRAINANLAAATITFIDDGLIPRVDPFSRTVTRRFILLPGQPKERFDQGGRLFGGFWINLETSRRANIRINGERAVILDYQSMFTRLAYAHLGVDPPDGDQYAVSGLISFRDGVKRAMSVLLFDKSSNRKAWPAEVKALLPVGWGVGRTKTAILQLHPQLKPAWGVGLGYGLMFTESEVLIAVLNALATDGIPALPLHDAIIVPASCTEVARDVMTTNVLRLTGCHIPVTVKH